MRLSLFVAAEKSQWPTLQKIAGAFGYALGSGTPNTKGGGDWLSALDNAASERLAGLLIGDITPPDVTLEDGTIITSAETTAAIAQCIVSVNGLTRAQRDALTEDEAAPVLKGKAHADKVRQENGLEVVVTPLD